MDTLIAGWICMTVGSVWHILSQTKKEETIQSVENWSKGTSIVGEAGSGKTVFAVWLAKKLLERGFKFCWITMQGERQAGGEKLGGLIDLLDSVYKNDIELMSPLKPHARGFNLIKCHTNGIGEIDAKAKTVARLIENMFDHVSENMVYGIELSIRAVLEYWRVTRQETTLFDAWQFTKNEIFREHILKIINKDNISSEIGTIKDETWLAIRRKYGSLLNTDIMQNAICYTKPDAIDLSEVFNKIFICDLKPASFDGLSHQQAKFIAQSILMLFDDFANNRTNKSTLYPIFCDEFYDYGHGIEDILKRFPDLHRQKRIPLVLIWQRIDQLSEKLLNVARSCVNQYIFKLDARDISRFAKMEFYKPYEDQIIKLQVREYLSILNVGKSTIIEKKSTETLTYTNPANYHYVVQNCKSKYKQGFEWWFDNYSSNNEIDISKFV
jgi:hypothetical protein